MQISTRTKIWMFTLVCLLGLNFYIAIHAVRELQITNQITLQDQKVTQYIQELQTEVINYHNSVLTYIVSQRPRDFEFHQKTRNQLLQRSNEESPSFLNEEIESKMNNVRAEIIELVALSENLSNSSRELGLSLAVTPYQKKFLSLLQLFDDLLTNSSSIVASDISRNQLIYDKSPKFLLFNLLLSILLLVHRYIYLKNKIIHPVRKLTHLLSTIRKGEVIKKWKNVGTAEIDEAGHTLNLMVDELLQRRRERIEFIGSVAHDLKNPLAAITLNCQLVNYKKNVLSRESILDVIDKISHQANQMQRLTEDLLLAAKENRPIWKIKRSTFNLVNLAHEVLNVARETDSQRTYTLVEAYKDVEIKADRDRINQVLTNLISNASKYSRPGTKVEVTIGQTLTHAYFEVRDQGIGIQEKEKESIFQPLTRLENGQQMSSGTGLGLAIVKEIIDSHTGKISVNSPADGGTVFRVELPLLAYSQMDSR